MRDMSKFWAFPWLQATGLVGLAALFMTAPIALWVGTRRALGFAVDAPWLRIHRQLSVAALVLVALHVVLTVLDNMGDSWRTVLIPGTWANQGWPEAVTGYNTGILALYGMAIFASSYYFGGLRIGVVKWSVLHRSLLIVYTLSIWHALILGLDIAFYSWIRPFIWLWQLPFLGLLLARAYFAARSSADHGRRACALAWGTIAAGSAATMLAIAWLVLSGNSGWIKTV